MISSEVRDEVTRRGYGMYPAKEEGDFEATIRVQYAVYQGLLQTTWCGVELDSREVRCIGRRQGYIYIYIHIYQSHRNVCN